MKGERDEGRLENCNWLCRRLDNWRGTIKAALDYDLQDTWREFVHAVGLQFLEQRYAFLNLRREWNQNTPSLNEVHEW